MSTTYTKANEAVLASSSKVTNHYVATNNVAPLPGTAGIVTPTARYVTVVTRCDDPAGQFDAVVWVKYASLGSEEQWSRIAVVPGDNQDAKAQRLYIGAAEAVHVAAQNLLGGIGLSDCRIHVLVELPQ